MIHKKLFEKYDFEGDVDCMLSDLKPAFNIKGVVKINNPHLHGMYLLCKEELQLGGHVNEKTLYHATSSRNAMKIAKTNIDWRLTNRSRFDKGACFASSPQYSERHSSKKGAIVIFKVLVQNVQRIGVRYGLNVPRKLKNDTTLGYGKVYVKYDDHNFYLAYIV